MDRIYILLSVCLYYIGRDDFADMITVRRAEIEDIPFIMQFLDEHWEKGYSLAKNKEFFNWQYVKNDKVNIWIGIDEIEKKVYALQDCVIYRSSDNPDISGTLWRAIKSDNPLLALQVQEKMWDDIDPRASFSPGLREDAVKVYKALGYSIKYMCHYYRLGSVDEFKIAKVENKSIPEVDDYGFGLRVIKGVDEFSKIISEEELVGYSPSRDYEYIKWRYFDHPIYDYLVYAIENNVGKDVAVIILREECAIDSKVLKIIDYYGNPKWMMRITSELDQIMEENAYEYVDVYSYGIPDGIYEKAGMLRCDALSENIIPQYFQPYECKNVDFAIIPPDVSSIRVFRGDSGLDRPRFLWPY